MCALRSPCSCFYHLECLIDTDLELHLTCSLCACQGFLVLTVSDDAQALPATSDNLAYLSPIADNVCSLPYHIKPTSLQFPFDCCSSLYQTWAMYVCTGGSLLSNTVLLCSRSRRMFHTSVQSLAYPFMCLGTISKGSGESQTRLASWKSEVHW